MTSGNHAPTFWMTGDLTGGELRIANSPGGLIMSLVEGYGVLPAIPATKANPASRYQEWLELRQHARYAYACDIATEYQARALVRATRREEWSLEGETAGNIDRLYTSRSYVPDNRPWAPGNVRLIIVHPVLESLKWEPPPASRSLVVIDPRTEVDLLRGLDACGALSSAGRLDLRSRYQHPMGL